LTEIRSQQIGGRSQEWEERSHHRDTEAAEKRFVFGLSGERWTNQNQLAFGALMSICRVSTILSHLPPGRAGDLLGGNVSSPSEQNITLLCALRASVVKISFVYPLNPVALF
jgi:hypothetical protein